MSVWRRVRREAEARSAEWSALAATRNAAVKDLYEEEQQLIVSGADAWELALLYYRRLMDYAGADGRVWESDGDTDYGELQLRIPADTVRTTTGGGPTGQRSDVDACLSTLLTPHGLQYPLHGTGALLSMLPFKPDAVADISPGVLATVTFVEKLRNKDYTITFEDVVAYTKATGMLARSTPTPGQTKFIKEICLPELNTQRTDQCFIGLKRIPDGGTSRWKAAQ